MAKKMVHDDGEPWDASDIEVLKMMLAMGKTYQECADRLGRTKAAVHGKIYRLSHG